MKKIITTVGVLCFAFAAKAEDVFDPMKDRQLYFDILNICAVLTGLYLISSFLQRMVKQYYSYRIRNRMLDKGTEVDIIKEILQPDKKQDKNYILQWFCMLLAIGAGLTLINFIRPFGLHSLAILAFSVAAGFGAFWYFSKRTES